MMRSASSVDEQSTHLPDHARTPRRPPSVDQTSQARSAPGAWPSDDAADFQGSSTKSTSSSARTSGTASGQPDVQSERDAPRSGSSAISELRELLGSWVAIPVGVAARTWRGVNDAAKRAYGGTQTWLAERLAPSALRRVTELNAELQGRVGTHLDALAVQAKLAWQQVSASVARLATSALVYAVRILEQIFAWFGTLSDTVAASAAAGFEAGATKTRDLLDGLRERLAAPRN